MVWHVPIRHAKLWISTERIPLALRCSVCFASSFRVSSRLGASVAQICACCFLIYLLVVTGDPIRSKLNGRLHSHSSRFKRLDETVKSLRVWRPEPPGASRGKPDPHVPLMAAQRTWSRKSTPQQDRRICRGLFMLWRAGQLNPQTFDSPLHQWLSTWSGGDLRLALFA
jgi:hypothetical protein